MNLSPVLKQRFFDSNGAPLSGGSLYSYQAGTTTPQTTYADSTGTPNANPVVLDSSGYADVWLDPTLSYKLVLKDSGGVTQFTIDNVSYTLGISAWSANATYQQGSIVIDSSGKGLLYVSLINNNQNQALTNVSAWRLFAGNVSTVSSNTTVAVTDDLIRSNSTSGALTHTLPACSTTPIGKRVTFKDVGTGGNATSLKGNGTDLIDGNNTFKFTLKQYGSITVENNGSSWDVISLYGGSASSIDNSLLNSAFDWWQRNTTLDVAYSATRTFTYIPDRWAVWNGVGTGAVVTGSQVAGTINGSQFGFKVVNKTAPGTASAVGPAVFHTLHNNDSLPYYGNNGCFSANIKAVGNVTGVTLQFFQSAGMNGVASGLATIGSAVTVAINSSTFSLGQIVAQAMGTAQGLSGVVGVAIVSSAVSSGNLSDIGNGFILEQTMMNVGSTPAPYKRSLPSTTAEFEALLAYHENSFGSNQVEADLAGFGNTLWQALSPAYTGVWIPYRAKKLIGGESTTFYNPVEASAGNKIYNHTQAKSFQASNPGSSYLQFDQQSTGVFVSVIAGGAVVSGDLLSVDWAADAEIY